ncbi:xanthine dehydrogenase accessory protein PucB [Ectobacillus funiculus]
MGPGMHKLCLPMKGTSLGNLALNTALASNLSEVIVITNFFPLGFLEGGQKERIHLLSCQNASLGQSYSLRQGIEKAESLQADGAMVMLADQPFITVETLNTIIREFQQCPELQYVAAAYQDIPRPPVFIFPAIFFSGFEKKLKGDQGARFIFLILRFEGRSFRMIMRDCFYDVDTWEDYHAASR